jgi:hypothetical protein
MHYAVAEANREAIQILQDAGARIDIRNSEVHLLDLLITLASSSLFQDETAYDLAGKQPGSRYLLHFFSKNQSTISRLPKSLQFSKSARRFGTKLFPYLILFLLACIFQWQISLSYKSASLLALFMVANVYIR